MVAAVRVLGDVNGAAAGCGLQRLKKFTIYKLLQTIFFGAFCGKNSGNKYAWA